MNFPQNTIDVDFKINSKIASAKNSMTRDIFKSIPSNQMTINFSKESNSSDAKNLTKSFKQKKNIFTIEKEEKGISAEEEEEINSDEYVSSTMLDVDTNTYINMTNNTKNLEENNYNKINKNNNNNYNKGRLRSKENNKDLDVYLLNKIQTITNEKDLSLNNTKKFKKINNETDMTIHKTHHQNNKSDFLSHDKPASINKEKRNNSNSIDKKGIFTPKIESKNKLKILRDIIIQKLDHYHSKNPFFLNQSNTINIIESIDDLRNEYDNIKSFNNDSIKKNIKFEIDNKNKRNKTSRITHNNSISIISNKSNKNMPIENHSQQHIQNNNNININIFNKNIIKDIGAINIDDQKYQLIPQAIKKIKTQGRIGKIVYTNQNKKNNYIYINNYSNNINNKTINSPLNKKNNRISPPPNTINNVEFYNSICANKNKRGDEHYILKHTNIHSLKNLKSENSQKSIKRYILGEDYLTIFPMSNGKSNCEKQKIKIIKNSKNNKNIKNKNNKCNNDDVKYKPNNYKIKKIIPLNINDFHNKQIRNFNSCFPPKINKYMNNYPNEQLLNTISNNSKKVDIYNSFKNNCTNFTQNKNNFSSNKKIFDEKMKKSKELSFNSKQGNNSIKNILSLKNSKYLKNNKYSLQNSEINYESNIGDSNINYNIKKNKPITARIKLDLMTEGNKNNLIKNKVKNNTNSNENVHTKSIKNSSSKRVIYIDNNILKNFSTRPFIYNSLSPNCQSIKQLMNKSKISNIKEIYNNINIYNQGRNTYNSSHIHNKSNNFHSNINIDSNINNKIFIKKIEKENIKNNRSNNIAKSINYYIENMSQNSNSNLSPNHKKIIAFNNMSNYNINSTNHTLNNITNVKERSNNNIFKDTIEIMSPFSSINNKKNNNSHKKKYYVNKQNNEQGNNSHLKNKKKVRKLEQNIIYLDNSKIRNTHAFNGINCPNKYLYNKNMNYKLNYNENDNQNNIYINNSQLNYNVRFNNNPNNDYIHFSNSNDKERNTISNKIYGNNNMNRNKKVKNSKEKNISLEIIEKNQKSIKKKAISPIQELNNNF